MFVTFFGEAVLEVQGTGTKIGMLAIGLGWRSFLVIFRCDAAFKRFFGFLAINIPVLCTCEIPVLPTAPTVEKSTKSAAVPRGGA